MASIWDRLFSQEDYRTAAPSGGYADLYQDGLLARNRDEMPASVKAAQASQDFIPGIGDVLAFGEAGHALSEGDRKRAAILAVGGLLGTIPGAGPFIARPIMAAGRKAAGRKAADLANRIELDPLPSNPSLSAPRNEAEAMAKKVLEMRAAGNAGDVTEDMMALADDTYMFNNTPLPMDEASRMQRAGAEGMVDGYHGTMPSDADYIYRSSGQTADNPDIVGFDINRSTRGQSGKGIYFAPQHNIELANNFAGGRSLTENELKRLDPNSPKIQGVVYPVKVKADNQANYQQMRQAQYDYEAKQRAEGKSSGYAGLSDSVFNTLEPKGFTGVNQKHEFTTFHPEGVRSRFARFDPEFKHLRNLSAGVGGVGLLNAMMEEEQRQQQGLLQ